MISAKEAQNLSEASQEARVSRILSKVDEAIRRVAADGENFTTVFEPNNLCVLETLRELGYAVHYYSNDQYYHIRW